MKQDALNIFDAVRIVQLPDGKSEVPVHFSETGRTHLRIGDVGVVIGSWPLGGKLRVEAVDSSGAIVWQDHLLSEQLETIPVTDAIYNRRRVDNAWSWKLWLNNKKEILANDEEAGLTNGENVQDDALKFARNVMAFARQNVDTLVDRLIATGYRFASKHFFVPPSEEVSHLLQELKTTGVHLPIALQAWLLEVGNVDLCGSHPQWPRSAYVGLLADDESDEDIWFTDPLVIDVDLSSLLELAREDSQEEDSQDEESQYDGTVVISPDVVTKANYSGSFVSLPCAHTSFDMPMIGQHGSFTLLSYLRNAFAWAGFPGFDFIADPPNEMLKSMAKELVRL